MYVFSVSGVRKKDIFRRKNIVFYTCLNTIFLSGQKLHLTLNMLMK